MKMKSLVAVFLLCALCVAFCACGISREDAVGTWSGTYENKGNRFSATFVLSANGEYAKVVYKNGKLSSSEVGTWEIEGGDVVLHENGSMGGATRYEYKGKALVNNGHKFYKE